jgi:hypothetical protein
MTIKIKKLIDRNALYCQYSGQIQRQDCYIEIDCERETMHASYNGEIGNAVPFSVYHGHDQRFSIPCLTADAANTLMADIIPLARRVIDGYATTWDGNNHVARFTADAQAAIDEIASTCESVETDDRTEIQAWAASDWLQNVISRYDEYGNQTKYSAAITVKIDDAGTITGKTTDAELDAIETKISAEAEAESVIVDGIDDFLRDERDNCKNNAE